MIKCIHHISMKCETAEELTNVRKFYIETLGLKIIREWAEGMMIAWPSAMVRLENRLNFLWRDNYDE